MRWLAESDDGGQFFDTKREALAWAKKEVKLFRVPYTVYRVTAVRTVKP